jgi:hypothetical protein
LRGGGGGGGGGKGVVEEEKVAAVVEKGPNIEARPRAVLSNAIILAQILGKGQGTGSRFFHSNLTIFDFILGVV